ncbi:hypothetical protein I8920_00400 [Curtobacterium sp. YC1]|uniref:hypothetical protein n=1 Tax=Curtobacterium sp. YC1 TaxID=2795488 RepID=UPI0018E52312|nr:hypothetical protein [Curtobacterium sp. YC1]QQD76279.1 hypothetical protein I8920_00400 [Curtobacterium sp. YC1]
MTEDSGKGKDTKELRAMGSLAAYGGVAIVVFAALGALTDISGVGGIGVGAGCVLFGGGRALWLWRMSRRGPR